MGNGGGRGGWGAPAEGGGGPGGGGGGGGPPMFIGGGTTGGATESTAGWPWKGEPGMMWRYRKLSLVGSYAPALTCIWVQRHLDNEENTFHC